MRCYLAALGAIACLGTAAPSAITAAAPATFPPAIKDCPDCPEMRPVTIQTNTGKRTLMVGVYELTWKEYMVAVDEADCARPRNPVNRPLDLTNGKLRDRYPMTSIQPAEIGCYLSLIKSRTGKSYRLPTNDEWMKIANVGIDNLNIRMSDIRSKERDLATLFTLLPEAFYDSRDSVSHRLIYPVGFLNHKIPISGIVDLFGNSAEYTSDEVVVLEFIKKKNPNIRQIYVKGDWAFSKPDDQVIQITSRYFMNTISDNVGFRLVYERN